jgi:hypothetical protein
MPCILIISVFNYQHIVNMLFEQYRTFLTYLLKTYIPNKKLHQSITPNDKRTLNIVNDVIQVICHESATSL